MKHNRVVAALALAFALGIGLSIFNLSHDPSASASETDDGLVLPESASTQPADGEVQVLDDDTTQPSPPNTAQPDPIDLEIVDGVAKIKNELELIVAVADDSVSALELQNDIALLYAVNITRTTPLTINLNGFQLSISNNYAMKLYRGNLTITGTGTADASHNAISATSNSIVVTGSTNPSDQNWSTLTVDSNVRLYSRDMYAIAVVPYDTSTRQNVAYGVIVNMNGQTAGGYGLHINGLISDPTNRPQFNIGDTAQLLNDQEKLTSTPIYAAGTADWHIGAATIRGKAAIGMKAGTFTFNNTNVVIDGIEATPPTSQSGIITTSSVFQIEHNPSSYVDDVILNINGGTYTSANSYVFYEYGQLAAPADINITKGTFTAGTGKDIFGGTLEDGQANIEISGGTFHGADAATFVEKGYLATGLRVDANGNVVSNTPAPNPEDPENPENPEDPETPELPSRPSANIQSQSLKGADSNVTVNGNFGGKATSFQADLIQKKIAAFTGRKYVMYDLSVLDAAGNHLQPTGTATVTLHVPRDMNGNQSTVYYIDEGGMVHSLASQYTNGVVTFQAEHFSLYALVENSADNTPITGNINQAPGTGAILSEGISSAVSTVVPVIVIAGAIVAIYTKRIFDRRRHACAEAIECEINAEIAAVEKADEPEPVIERFVAVPIDRPEEPVAPIVDQFIPKA